MLSPVYLMQLLDWTFSNFTDTDYEDMLSPLYLMQLLDWTFLNFTDPDCEIY